MQTCAVLILLSERGNAKAVAEDVASFKKSRKL